MRASAIQQARRRVLQPIFGAIWLNTMLGTLLAVWPLQGILEAKTGMASYYTVHSCQREGTSGTLTASGRPYDEQAMTCTMPSHRFGGWYRVCGQAGCAVVQQTDYGPGQRARTRGVVIDLTPAAFQRVCGALRLGRCRVSVEPR